MRARRRGTWRLDRLWLRWPSRLRLLEFTPSVALDLTVAVVPSLRPMLSGIIDVAVRSQLFGAKENIVKGEGSEYSRGWLLLSFEVSWRSEEHTSELQSLMRISYAVFCLKK